MTDELRMESAYRHADHSYYEPWHGLAPDEALMRKEDGEDEDDLRADVQETLFVYAFSDGAGDWRMVMERLLAVMWRMTPALLTRKAARQGGLARGFLHCRGAFALEAFERMCERRAEFLERLLDWVFRGGDHQWEIEGTRRFYLMARIYQADLVRIGGRLPAYEDFAVVFGEIPEAAGPVERARARSRWSARAGLVLRKPLEAAGGKAAAMFGKSAAVRGKYAKAALGNQNRRKR